MEEKSCKCNSVPEKKVPTKTSWFVVFESSQNQRNEPMSYETESAEKAVEKFCNEFGIEGDSVFCVTQERGAKVREFKMGAFEVF